jgi:hypothetical protein
MLSAGLFTQAIDAIQTWPDVRFQIHHGGTAHAAWSAARFGTLDQLMALKPVLCGLESSNEHFLIEPILYKLHRDLAFTRLPDVRALFSERCLADQITTRALYKMSSLTNIDLGPTIEHLLPQTTQLDTYEADWSQWLALGALHTPQATRRALNARTWTLPQVAARHHADIHEANLYALGQVFGRLSLTDAVASEVAQLQGDAHAAWLAGVASVSQPTAADALLTNAAHILSTGPAWFSQKCR